MNAYNKLITKHLVFFNLLVLNNYFLHLINSNTFFLKLNIIFIFFYLFFLLFRLYKKENILIFFLLIFYLVIILASPTQDHDARSVWLFHAKRIYYDQSIYSQLDGYGDFSHNDYNPFVACLSASLAHLINGWNEIFPKFANLIIATPAILFINSFFKKKMTKTLFILVMLFIFEKRLVNGEMDAILALYVISVILSYFLILSSCTNKKDLFLTILLASIFASTFILIKNEAIVSLLLIFLIIFIFKYFKIINTKFKYFFFILAMPITFFLYWKFKVFNSNIKSIYLSNINPEFFKHKLINLKFYFEIFEGLVLNKPMFLSLIVFSYFIKNIINYSYNKKDYLLIKYQKSTFDIKLYLFIIIYCFFYFIFLFMIFLLGFGQDETRLSLEQGAFRYTQPIAFSLCCLSCFIFDNKKIKKHN